MKISGSSSSSGDNSHDDSISSSTTTKSHDDDDDDDDFSKPNHDNYSSIKSTKYNEGNNNNNVENKQIDKEQLQLSTKVSNYNNNNNNNNDDVNNNNQENKILTCLIDKLQAMDYAAKEQAKSNFRLHLLCLFVYVVSICATITFQQKIMNFNNQTIMDKNDHKVKIDKLMNDQIIQTMNIKVDKIARIISTLEESQGNVKEQTNQILQTMNQHCFYDLDDNDDVDDDDNEEELDLESLSVEELKETVMVSFESIMMLQISLYMHTELKDNLDNKKYFSSFARIVDSWLDSVSSKTEPDLQSIFFYCTDSSNGSSHHNRYYRDSTSNVYDDIERAGSAFMVVLQSLKIKNNKKHKFVSKKTSDKTEIENALKEAQGGILYLQGLFYRFRSNVGFIERVLATTKATETLLIVAEDPYYFKEAKEKIPEWDTMIMENFKTILL